MLAGVAVTWIYLKMHKEPERQTFIPQGMENSEPEKDEQKQKQSLKHPSYIRTGMPVLGRPSLSLWK